MTYADLGALTSPESAALAGEAVGVVQVGAVEQHGPHLPLRTDCLITEAVVRGVAARVEEPLVVAPLIAAGLSEHHVRFPGTVTLAREVFDGVVEAHIAAFARIGVRRVALLSCHGGNFRALGEIAAASLISGVDVHAYSDFERFLQVMAAAGRQAGLDPPETDSHAGAFETSMVLTLAGADAVRDLDSVDGYTAAEPGWLQRMTSDGVDALSATGVIGRPAGATATAGRREIDALCEEIAGWLTTTFGLRPVGGATGP
ncbi:MAG: creatinine amidohydrolase [Solirubrobacteraceae bacterium]|nr:creatinine amidohydrolase [Solirubrobacteraceae bacterium]